MKFDIDKLGRSEDRSISIDSEHGYADNLGLLVLHAGKGQQRCWAPLSRSEALAVAGALAAIAEVMPDDEYPA